MELKCPNCGKHIALSKEELATSTCMVVCPQCLEEWVVSDVDLEGVTPRVSRRDSQPATESTEAFRFCGECGKKLPAADLNFCPYCGKRLHPQPTASNVASDIAVTPVPPEPSPEKPERPKPKGTPTITYFPYSPMFKRQWVEEKPASLPVRILCYLIIAALLALFVFIVYKGLQ
ncbi:MAG: hypothetical protein IK092_05455 [Muribaculaceae bacterium]|nr:hypothetical protein [Muribaculaceae bacterium]